MHYDAFIDETEQLQFYIGLVEYLEFVYKNEKTKQIVMNLLAPREKMKTSMNKLSSALEKESHATYQELLDIFNDKKISE